MPESADANRTWWLVLESRVRCSRSRSLEISGAGLDSGARVTDHWHLAQTPSIQSDGLQGLSPWWKVSPPNKRLKLPGGDRCKGSRVLCPGGHVLIVQQPCAGKRVARSLSAVR